MVCSLQFSLFPCDGKPNTSKKTRGGGKRSPLFLGDQRAILTVIFDQDLRVGNKYRIGRKIGSGSFGDIYLGKLIKSWSRSVLNDEANYPQEPISFLVKRLPLSSNPSRRSIRN